MSGVPERVSRGEKERDGEQLPTASASHKPEEIYKMQILQERIGDNMHLVNQELSSNPILPDRHSRAYPVECQLTENCIRQVACCSRHRSQPSLGPYDP